MGLILVMGSLMGCESHSQTVARCTEAVSAAEVRLSHTADVPANATEQIALAKIELTGTQPYRACRNARTAVELIRREEARTSILYIPVPWDLDYGWQSPSQPPSGSNGGSWSFPSGSSDSGGWSGSGGGGSDSGGWGGGGGGSDSGGW